MQAASKIPTTCFGERADRNSGSSALALSINGNSYTSSAYPYCALYNYPNGSVGYGCAPYTSYTRSVLLSIDSAGPLTGVSTPSSSTPSSSTSFSSTNSTATSSSTSASPTPNHQLSTHLSGGDIAGIAIGCAAAVIAIVILAVILILRRRKARNFEPVLEPRRDQFQSPPMMFQSDAGFSTPMASHGSYDPAHRNPVVSPTLYSTDGTAFELDAGDRSPKEQVKPKLVPTAVEETSRYPSPPVPGMTRYT